MDKKNRKIQYEAEKEKERQRRFNILSGEIKPIQTTIRLKEGEDAYYQVEASRLADRDYIESYTQGDARSPFIKGGILRGNTKINTTTTQSHSTRHETVDAGAFLLTNLRVLFVGKEVTSIPYEDILSIELEGNTVTIKYPGMAKNESYSLGKDWDADVYYHGVMRVLGKEKSDITEANVDMTYYPRFTSDEEIQAKKSLKITSIAFIVILFLIKIQPLLILVEIGLIIAVGIFAKRNRISGGNITSIVSLLFILLIIFIFIDFSSK